MARSRNWAKADRDQRVAEWRVEDIRDGISPEQRNKKQTPEDEALKYQLLTYRGDNSYLRKLRRQSEKNFAVPFTPRQADKAIELLAKEGCGNALRTRYSDEEARRERRRERHATERAKWKRGEL
jgi:hypothetical protein